MGASRFSCLILALALSFVGSARSTATRPAGWGEELAAPVIETVSLEEVEMAGGQEVVVTGSNFAPGSVLTYGEAEVTGFEVVNASEIRLRMPSVQAPGCPTLTVRTQGWSAQRVVFARARRVEELTAGEMTTIAGGVPHIADGGPATAALLSSLWCDVVVDASGNLFIADPGNSRVRRVDASTGLITTVAGTGVSGYNGDKLPAMTAWLAGPSGAVVDASRNLFIVDSANHAIRVVKGPFRPAASRRHRSSDTSRMD